MKLTLKRFDEKEWQNQLDSLDVKDLFGKPEFLQTISKAYNVNVIYQGVFRNEKPILLLAFFEKKKKIIFPNHYFFQFSWQSIADDQWTIVEAWELVLNKITNGYQKIKLRLPITTEDIRPFVWNGFHYRVKNTYIKNLDELDYHQNIKRIIAKPLVGFQFVIDDRPTASFPIHSATLRQLLFKKSFVENLEHWLLEAAAFPWLKVFAVKRGDEIVASIVALIDQDCQKAYFPLISKPDADLPKEIPAKLYDFSLKSLKEMGIKNVDLYGADLKSIARFKAKLNPTLASFFEVEYHAGKQVIDLLADEVKQRVKKIWRS